MKHPTETYPNQKLINGQWGYKYDPATKVMLGGYSQDGLNFTHTYTINNVEKKDVMFAIALCGLLYGKTRQVEVSYNELVGDESKWRMLRYDAEFHNL